jgi:hypothetical protein
LKTALILGGAAVGAFVLWKLAQASVTSGGTLGLATAAAPPPVVVGSTPGTGTSGSGVSVFGAVKGLATAPIIPHTSVSATDVATTALLWGSGVGEAVTGYKAAKALVNWL